MTTRSPALLAAAAVLITSLAGFSAVDAAAPAPPAKPPIPTWTGAPQALGNGTVRSFAEIRAGKPLALGVVLTASALQGLPSTPPTDGEHCFDVDQDGAIDPMLFPMGECVAGYEYRLPLSQPKTPAPYQYVMLNWNPGGHTGHVFGNPHFDFHFYLTSQAETDAIRMGPCGELIDCADQVRAVRPLPAQFMPAGYVDPPDSEEGAMGDHLVDPTSPVGADFRHTMIYGKYDAKLTFIEPMITRNYILSIGGGAAPTRACHPIKQPTAWQQPGWYPRSYCVRWASPRGGTYTVTLEDFARAG